MKTCCTCKQTKTLTNFYKSKTETDGCQIRCKICTNLANKKVLVFNKEKQSNIRSTLIQIISKLSKEDLLKNCDSDLQRSIVLELFGESEKKLPSSKKGKPISEEHKKKIAAANTGRRCSEETKYKISIIKKDKPKVGRKVIDTTTGIIYQSITAASNSLGINYGTLRDRIVKKYTKKPILEYCV